MNVRLKSIFRASGLSKLNNYRALSGSSDHKFLESIKAGRLEEVKNSLDVSSNSSIARTRYQDNDKDINRGNFALHVAFESGQLGIANFLLGFSRINNLALLSDINSIGVPPWVYALLYFYKRNFTDGLNSNGDDKNILLKILSADEFRSSFINCPTLLKFVESLHTNNEQSIVEYASNPKIITEKDPFGFNALHYSTARDSLFAVEKLLKNPALDAKKTLDFLKYEDLNGNNVLHIAVGNVAENSELVSILLKSLKDCAREENAQKISEISERFELKNFLRKPNNYGYDPFYIALTTDSIRNFSKVFFKYGYNIHEPAYIVYDIKNTMNLVFRVPSTLIAFKWLKGDDNKIKLVIQWLFRHGADLDLKISLDTLNKLEMNDVAMHLKHCNPADQNRIVKCTLADIAEYYGYPLTRDFLLENGGCYSDHRKTVKYHETHGRQQLLTNIQSYGACLPLSQNSKDELRSLNQKISKKELEEKISSGHTAFSLAIVHGYYVVVEQALSAHPELLSINITLNFDGRQDSKNTPLHLAVRYGKDKGGLSFFQDKEHNQCTLLEILLSKNSIWYKNHLSIKILLIENDKKLTSLNLAARNGYLFGVKAIINCYLDKISKLRAEESLCDREDWNLLVNDIRKSFKLANDFHRYAIQYYLLETLSVLGINCGFKPTATCIYPSFAEIISANDLSSLEPLFDSIVFQGGGVRGISHVGAIQQLEEQPSNIVDLKKLKYVGGTSVGAIISALYAAGYKSSELSEIIIKTLKLPTLLEGAQEHYSEFEYLYQKYHRDPNKLNAIRESFTNIFSKLMSFYKDNKVELESLHQKYHHDPEKWNAIKEPLFNTFSKLMDFYKNKRAEIESTFDWYIIGKWYNNYIGNIKLGLIGYALYKELRPMLKQVDITKEDLEQLKRLVCVLIPLYSEIKQIIEQVDIAKEDLKKLMNLCVILYNEKGIFSGDKLRDILEGHIQDKTGIEHITFEELHLFASVKSEVKDVSLVVVDTMRKKTHVLSYLLDPHHIVSDGALSSASVPLFFKPHERYVKPPGRKRALDVTDEGALYVDGGLNDNFPEWLFKDVSPNTLGIRLLKPSLWSKYTEGIFDADKKSENFFQFAYSLYRAILAKQESDFDIKCNPLNTILINTQTVSTLDFNASTEDKKKLIDAGREAVRAYLGSQSSVLLQNKAVIAQTNKKDVPNFSRFFTPTCYCGRFENCPSEQDEPKNSSRLT